MTNTTDAMDFGFGGIWGIIMLLIVAGLFSGGGFGFGNNASNVGIADEFIKRDIFNTNTSVLTTANATQNAIESSKYDLGTQIQQNRYDASLASAGLEKDILLGNAGVNQNILLGNQTAQAQMASCCCDLKTAIHSEGEETRALITQNRIADLEKELNLAQIVASNQTQTQNILNSLGNYYPRSGVNPYYVYGYNGTTIV